MQIKQESKIDYIDSNVQVWAKAAANKPQEPMPVYRKIRELIQQQKYEAAVKVYYESLGSEPYGELTNEFIYLKRLARINLSGRDLLYFRSESFRDELIKQNLGEYIHCIDQALGKLTEIGRKSPLKILLEYAPTKVTPIVKTTRPQL